MQIASHRFIWHCPMPLIEKELYHPHIGERHCELGPGTGRTLRRLPKSTPLQELHLVDLNPACLARSSSRLRHRFNVHPHEVGALGEWPIPSGSLDSVSATDVMHCLPGDNVFDKKGMVDNAAKVLRPGGMFFGATFLQGHTGAARSLLNFYNNKRNTMHNRGDTFSDLERLFSDHPGFANVQTKLVGTVGLWAATRVEGDA
ncbi:ubiquinone/menaquinone biosynthesis C-methylase UbiE [Lipingzhangella halophila]|uniref:Ubiquinone/menaquinone biosynthesis C-methylase UbiE n=1 Tax=Lipingzhangella halophila TaxID=1783352 RepID=A0A7W7W6T9_9ACTN|nr:class I SAM-dependent methyltransferase [Lipingzhangella halophila]MBB4935175.1 ubiquinone/menaquinone biosynthesis C-methylase UbiE [Lipingzhangella halophila]